MGADRITQGSLGTTGQDVYDSPGALIVDAVDGTIAVVTSTRTIAFAASRILNVPQQTALTAITTAQNLLSQSMGAGSLNVAGRSVRVRGTLMYSTTSTNVATITIALKLGSVTLCTITTAATNTAASTNLQIQFDFTFTVATTGTGATIQAHGRLDANIGTATSGAVTTYFDTNTGVSSAVDLTVAETLLVTIAASAAVPSATLLSASIDLLA
jgi:hypothetical protein